MGIERFVEAVEAAVDQENWYAALVLGLTLPDICGRLENPAGGSRLRYETWWNRFMQHHYRHRIFDVDHTFMSAGDAYALRCAVLHEGRDDIVDQRARSILNQFKFTRPSPQGYILHNIKVGGKLQLQVDVYCRQTCNAVRAWSASTLANVDVERRSGEMIVIDNGFTC